MSQRVQRAVIAAAGSATRMWPATRVYPKELLPLGRLPAIGYLAWEFSEAGIEEIYVVGTTKNLHDIEEFFAPGAEPPAKVANDPLVMAYRKAVEGLRFRFMTQEGPYGNATPLLTAIPHLKNEPCIYAFGDDIVLRENVTTSLLELYSTAQCPILAAQEVTPEAAASFGIIETHDRNGFQYVSRLVEKPKPGDTPSRLASLGRYLVTSEILSCLTATETGREGELWFVDAILAHMKKGGSVATLTLQSGKWFTVGDPPNFCQAVQEAYLAGATPFDKPTAGR